MLVNARGEGVGRDNWEIVNADSGATKATGVAHAIHNDPKLQQDPQPFEALSIGRLADGTRFFTNAKVTLPAPGTDERIVIEYGGVTEPKNRALAVAGRCDGLLEGA